MTVCIAGICQWSDFPYIVTLSDKQLTTERVAYEPLTRSKLWVLPDANTVILQAGADEAYTTIASETERIVVSRQLRDVEEIARVYSERFIALRRRRAEIQYLSPLGLDMNTFVARQNELRPELAARLTDQLTHAELEVEAIIAGFDNIDPVGVQAHIYTVQDPGIDSCQDGVGYAAIGEGDWLAENVLMKARYDARCSANEAIILAYWAKKEADRASTVGPDTDVFIIHPQGEPVRSDLAAELDKQFTEHMKRAEQSLRKELAELTEFAKDILTPIPKRAE